MKWEFRKLLLDRENGTCISEEEQPGFEQAKRRAWVEETLQAKAQVWK